MIKKKKNAKSYRYPSSNNNIYYNQRFDKEDSVFIYIKVFLNNLFVKQYFTKSCKSSLKIFFFSSWAILKFNQNTMI